VRGYVWITPYDYSSDGDTKPSAAPAPAFGTSITVCGVEAGDIVAIGVRGYAGLWGAERRRDES